MLDAGEKSDSLHGIANSDILRSIEISTCELRSLKFHNQLHTSSTRRHKSFLKQISVKTQHYF